MGLCLANIGRSEANLCRFLYSQVCCGYCNYVKRRNRRLKATTHQLRAKSLHNSIHKKRPASDKVNKTMSELESLNQADLDKKNELNETKSDKKILKLDDADMLDFVSDTNSVDFNRTSVPISVVVTILISYVSLGGYILSELEGWSLLDGIYFSVVTLTTIGFGDFVPGQSIKDSDTQSQLRSLGCAFYLLMGISLVLMSINLMQEEIIAKIKRLGVALGFVSDPDYY